MFKDYLKLLVLVAIAVGALGISLIKELSPAYVGHQKTYYEKLGIDDVDIEIKQVNVKTPAGDMLVDRCQSCHVGAANPDAKDFGGPIGTHPPIAAFEGKDPHDFNKIGCVVCHDGNGRGLELHDAHGEHHGWPSPLLGGNRAQANCIRCHSMDGDEPLAGAEMYHRGKNLFLEKACWGCHTIAGVSSASQAPELTDAGGKFDYDYLVESIIEPMANTHTSKMPQFDWVNDGELVAALAIFLKGQQKNRLRTEESAPIGYAKPKTTYAQIDEPSLEVGRALYAGAPVKGAIARGGCINCHAVRSNDGTLSGGKICPELTYALRARGKDYVREHIRNSRTHTADSIMPIFKDYSDAELESLVMFLESLTYTASPDHTGRQIYETFCMSCHGAELDGRGELEELLDPLPRDFSKYQFVAAYEERFKNSLREGIAGTAMPPWKNVLSDDAIESVIDYIKQHSLKGHEDFVRLEAKLPKAGDPERLDYKEVGKILDAGNVDRGYAQFQKFCASCHGKLANGKGPNAYDLEHPLPRNLLNAPFLNQTTMTDQRLYESILLGVAGAPMPAHDHLSDQTILDLIAFIRSNTTKQETTDEN